MLMSNSDPVVLTQEQAYQYIGESDSHVYLTVLTSESLGKAQYEDADEGTWRSKTEIRPYSKDYYNKIRYLSEKQPHVKRCLDLYECYLAGTGFGITVKPKESEMIDATDAQKKVHRKITQQSKEISGEFLNANKKWWTVGEYIRRTYRDGDTFEVKKTPDTQWPPKLKFYDPDVFTENSDNDRFKTVNGVTSLKNDPTEVVQYRGEDTETHTKFTLPANKVFHTKIDVDSNVRRGISRFESVINTMFLYNAFVRNEIQMRTFQSSILMVRKVKGSRDRGVNLLNNARTSSTNYPEGDMNRESIRPGSIVTVNEGVDIEFVQPNTNYSDASGLGRLLLLMLSAATGFTYEQITTDLSDSSFEVGLIAESPVLQMVEKERRFFSQHLEDKFKWVFDIAITKGMFSGYRNPTSFWKKYKIDIEFQDIVSRDPLKLAQAVNIGIMTRTLSKREAVELSGRNFEVTDQNLKEEAEKPWLHGTSNELGGDGFHNPTEDEKKASSANNANIGGGTNQDQGKKPSGHSDKLS
jgi:hypothetical protein